MAFTASANSSFVDIGSAKVEHKIAGLLTIHGAQPSLKRVYVAGVHPTSRQSLRMTSLHSALLSLHFVLRSD